MKAITFLEITYVLVIFPNHTLNLLGALYFLLSHSTTSYGTTASLGNLTVVKFVMIEVSYMA